MSNDVPLLTADQARWLTIHRSVAAQHDVDAIQDSVTAIIEGRAVVVPRMSEAEAMAMCAHNAGSADDYAINLDGYIAALRDLGLIRG